MEQSRLAVIEFLSQVPVLQRLPSSSIMRIAEVIQLKKYEPGDYLVREGETGEGVYFIWEGQVMPRIVYQKYIMAEVSGIGDTAEGNRAEVQLKKFDYFGYGDADSIHEVNVIAMTNVTCLVLEHEYTKLLRPKSIWNADETSGDVSLVEHILHLEPIEVDLFRGFTLPGSPKFRQVYGGQFVGQALAAASKTVDCLKLPHSLHACFIIAGDNDLPIIYRVHRLHDGNNFATRRVDAMQHGTVVFTLLASFQREQNGFEHQEASMPSVPAPETLLSLEDLRERRIMDPRLPVSYRNTVAREKFVPWPLEIKLCDLNNLLHPSSKQWFRVRGKLSDDPTLHRCAAAYASDLLFIGVSLNPHRRKGLKTSSLSLDHSIWFHRPVKADDWLLYDIHSPSAYGGRGFVCGRMFNSKGELVMSLTQEGLIRKLNSLNQPPKPKL